jgi:hypothetical protein
VQWRFWVLDELYSDPSRLILHKCSSSSFARVQCLTLYWVSVSVYSFFLNSKSCSPTSCKSTHCCFWWCLENAKQGDFFTDVNIFFLQTLHPFICRSADTLFRKRKRLAVVFHKVMNRLLYFYDTWWCLDFCVVHTTVFINTNSFFVQVTKWADSSNALHAVYCNLNIWNGLGNGWHKPKRVAVYLVRNKRVLIYITAG